MSFKENLIRLGKSFAIAVVFGFVSYIVTGSEASAPVAMFLWYYEYHRQKKETPRRF